MQARMRAHSHTCGALEGHPINLQDLCPSLEWRRGSWVAVAVLVSSRRSRALSTFICGALPGAPCPPLLAVPPPPPLVPHSSSQDCCSLAPPPPLIPHSSCLADGKTPWRRALWLLR